MKPGSLNIEQIAQLQKDKSKGKPASELMAKYGIGKTSYYKYIKSSKEEFVPEEGVEQVVADFEDEYEADDEESEEEEEAEEEEEEVESEMELVEEDSVDSDNYLAAITSKPVPQKAEPKKDPKKVEKKAKLKAPKAKVKKTPAKKTPEDNSRSEEKDRIIQKITNYTEHFRDKLVVYLPIKGDKYGKYISGLYKKSEEDLVNELDFIRGKITNTNTKMAFKMAYSAGANAIETAGPYLGLQLQGLTEEVNRSKEIDLILSELSCEYSFNKYMDPRFRLLAHTGFSILKIDSMNKRKILIERADEREYEMEMNEIADDTLKEKYHEI